MRPYLLVLGEREAVASVLRQGRMAFPGARQRAELGRVKVGDELLIHTTRGCWHSPGRDRGRVIGRAYVTSTVTALDAPVVIAGRKFTSVCDIDVRTLTPYLSGAELAPLVRRLAAFPDKENRSIWLRRPLSELPSGDANMVRKALTDVESPTDECIAGYLDNIKPVGWAARR